MWRYLHSPTKKDLSPDLFVRRTKSYRDHLVLAVEGRKAVMGGRKRKRRGGVKRDGVVEEGNGSLGLGKKKRRKCQERGVRVPRRGKVKVRKGLGERKRKR